MDIWDFGVGCVVFEVGILNFGGGDLDLGADLGISGREFRILGALLNETTQHKLPQKELGQLGLVGVRRSPTEGTGHGQGRLAPDPGEQSSKLNERGLFGF